MQSPKTWRQLLGTIVSDPQEEQRLIDIMGIRPITLVRWVQNKSEPRPYFLRQLLDALPQHRDSLLPLMEKEFPGFSEMVEDDLPKEIASSFYTHVLDTYIATAPSMRFWSICPLILQHVLEHLDPDQLGMELLVVRCTPPFPIMLASRIAGCLLVSSTQPYYFHRPRLTILKRYTNLLALAFQTEDFSDLASIELNMMPAQHIQRPYFATFRQRVADVLAQAKARQQSLTSQQAEQLARQQLEQELLQIPL